MTKEEQKEKYSAFIAEVSEILGLGKPVDILKLCMITDRFFKPYQKRIAELEAENEQIKNSDTLCKLIGEQKRKITDLEAQIEQMKCCINDLVHLGEFNEHTDEEYFNYQVHEALNNAGQFIKEIKEK